MRAILGLALALAAAPGAASAETIFIHAGQLLDQPGKAPRGPSTIVVRDGKIAEAGNMDKEAGRAIVHGMPTGTWKALHHTPATPEQLARMEESLKRNAPAARADGR